MLYGRHGSRPNLWREAAGRCSLQVPIGGALREAETASSVWRTVPFRFGGPPVRQVGGCSRPQRAATRAVPRSGARHSGGRRAALFLRPRPARVSASTSCSRLILERPSQVGLKPVRRSRLQVGSSAPGPDPAAPAACLTLLPQVNLTGLGGPDGLSVEGEPEALNVVRDGGDGPLHLTGDLVAADAVSVELTVPPRPRRKRCGPRPAHPLTRAR